MVVATILRALVLSFPLASTAFTKKVRLPDQSTFTVNDVLFVVLSGVALS